MTLLRFLLVLIAAMLANPTQADELRPGYLEVTQRDALNWNVIWKAPVLGGLASRAHPAFPEFCEFRPEAAQLLAAAVVERGTLTCSKPLDGAQVGLDGIDNAFTDALLRIGPLGRPVQAERLTPSNGMVTVTSLPRRWQVAQTYFVLGIEHILTGYDHLLFVVALVLLLMRGMAVVKAATAFTLAHSITLAGTTLGFLGVAQAPVEATIALSIVFLAAEVAKQKPGEPRLSERVPWVVAFLFGLLHGFGFAGALREIGLPETDVPVALLTFNLGVEAGQLMIIAATMAVLAALTRFAPWARRSAIIGSTYLIGAVASFWFIERIWA